jgi:hypothetical protein
MAYRGDEGDALEAPTAEGLLRLELGPREVRLTVGQHSLVVAGQFATVVDLDKPDKRTSLKIDGRLVVARDVPHEDLGVWIELGDPPGMRRIFGVAPVSLMDPHGLVALRRLDGLAQRLRGAVDEINRDRLDPPTAVQLGDIRRAIEIGRGLDKILLADHGDRYVVYARRLFRDRARFALAIHDDGRIVLADGKRTREIIVTSRFGVTVWGDYVRFTDAHGVDLGKVSIPWIGPEDRLELARRIGQLVDNNPNIPDKP